MKTVFFASVESSKRDEIENLFREAKWEISTAENMKESLEIIQKKRPLVIIIPDLEGDIDGYEIIKNVRNIFSDSFFMIIVHNADFYSAQKAHNAGVYRIYEKIEAADMLTEGEKIFNIYNLKLTQKTIEENKEEKIKEKYERMYWKESMMLKSDISASVNLVRTLRNYFAQANIGALISMIKVVQESIPPADDGSVILDKELAGEIFESADVGAKILESLNQYVHLAADECNFEICTVSDFFEILYSSVDSLKQKTAEKKTSIILGTGLYLNANSKMNLDKKRIRVVINELLINALKFSKKDDKVYVIPVATSTQIGIQIINTAYQFRKGVIGIPLEYQKKIFEPFFKMMEYSDTFFFKQEITSGLGLGLTLVKSIIEKHGAGVTITNITDHFENKDTPTIKVMAEVTFLREL